LEVVVVEAVMVVGAISASPQIEQSLQYCNLSKLEIDFDKQNSQNL